MRGKVTHRAEHHTTERITPAYAGKRQLSTPHTPCTEDHPRLCGEKHVLPRQEPYPKGSPPPMRGKAQCIATLTRENRITPAYAGKSIIGAASGSGSRDHPRLCGEKAILPYARGTGTGSPPPMRGKVGLCLFLGVFLRITPAYAGKRPKVPCCISRP